MRKQGLCTHIRFDNILNKKNFCINITKYAAFNGESHVACRFSKSNLKEIHSII